MNFIHSLGLSVHYSRIWEILNRIAKSVVGKINADGGLYLPADILQGKFTHFAIDNIDFQEDTPNGRNSYHGTVVVIYQTIEEGYVTEDLKQVSDE